MKIALTVNGTPITREVEGRENLVDFLRYDLGFTGSHIGCEHGVCGACTVRVDGTPIRGCLMLAAQADGCRVETIEGVAESGAIAALQRAFRAENALQCGFCTPGMLLTAQALLERNPDPDPVAIREAIGGNYCRCTGYHAIVQAILGAARSRSAKAPAARLRRPSQRMGTISAARWSGRRPRGSSRGAAPTPTTWRCPGSCTRRSCARRTRTRASPGSTPRRRPRCPGWWRW